MPFYKKDNGQLLAEPNSVQGPTFHLLEENHTEHTYPVDGWYWYATLEEAMAGMAAKEGSVTIRQAELAMAQTVLPDSSNMLTAVNYLVSQSSLEDQITWRRSVMVERDHPMITRMGPLLGLSESDIDAVFALARTK